MPAKLEFRGGRELCMLLQEVSKGEDKKKRKVLSHSGCEQIQYLNYYCLDNAHYKSKANSYRVNGVTLKSSEIVQTLISSSLHSFSFQAVKKSFNKTFSRKYYTKK